MSAELAKPAQRGRGAGEHGGYLVDPICGAQNLIDTIPTPLSVAQGVTRRAACRSCFRIGDRQPAAEGDATLVLLILSPCMATHDGLGKSQIPKARPLSLIISWLHVIVISPHKSLDRTIGIDANTKNATFRQEPSKRSGKANKVFDPAAVYELSAGQHSFETPPMEYKRIGSVSDAPY
jgi:hypothetical protein